MALAKLFSQKPKKIRIM